MSPKNNSTVANEKSVPETDILPILTSFGQRLLFAFFTSIVRKPLLFIGLVIVLTGGAYGIKIGLCNWYEGKLTLHLRYLPNSLAKEKLDRLQGLVRNHAKSILAKEMKLPEAAVESILKISYQEVSDSYQDAYKDSINTGYPFTVKLRLSNTNNLDSIQNGIIKAFQDDDYARIAIATRKKLFSESQIQTDRQIKYLDSLLVLINRSLLKQVQNTANTTVFSNIDAGDIVEELADLKDKQLLLETKTNLDFKVLVVTKLDIGTINQYPPLWIFIVLALFLAFPLQFILFGRQYF